MSQQPEVVVFIRMDEFDDNMGNQLMTILACNDFQVNYRDHVWIAIIEFMSAEEASVFVEIIRIMNWDYLQVRVHDLEIYNNRK
jgi:hypothetical protein